MKIRLITSGTIVACAAGAIFAMADDGPSLLVRHNRLAPSAEYLDAIHKTATMVSDPRAQQLANNLGLNVLNLTWEDMGRYKGSAVGPNISDMTIQVGVEDPQTRQFSVSCMPVIRFPNFADKTCDLDPHDFTVLVGNEKGRGLRRVSLYDFLQNPDSFLTRPDSWRSKVHTLLAPRDSKVLVSAQACFLPVPKQGLATFNPVIFNYQSVSGDPAVLTILATREGTSTTVIDNKRDAFSNGSMWGQRLFHNQNGQRASLTGQRFSDFRNGGATSGHQGDSISGSNMVLLIQVPLKQKHPMRGGWGTGGYGGAPEAGLQYKSADAGRSDVENAVIGHGAYEGPFTEMGDLTIERDPAYPIRVTVQFYKATSNGVVNEGDLLKIKNDIDAVYDQSDSVGSLVTQGETGRATEYWGSKVQPHDWWQQFWQRHEQNTGDTRAEAMAKLRRLLGNNYEARPVCDLYLHDLLRKASR